MAEEASGKRAAVPVGEVERLRSELASARAQLDRLGAQLHEAQVLSKRVEIARQAWAQTVDALEQPIFMHDETGAIVRANKAYADRAGLPVTNLAGKVYWKLFPLREGAFPAPQSGDTAEFEFTASPGEIFLVRSVGASAGLPPSWRLYILHDITGLKRTEGALRYSREYARDIIDSSPAIIVATDRERKIVEFNPAAERAFGYRHEEVLGQHVSLLYADAAAGDLVHRQVLDRSGVACEVGNRRKDGELFTSVLTASILRDPEDKVLGVVGISRDVSETKQAELKVQAALAQIELIFDGAAAGIALTRSRTFERVNRRFVELFGYEKKDLLGRSTELLYASREDYDRLARDAYPELGKGNIYEGEVKFKRKDGALRRVHLAGRPIMHERLGMQVVWVVEDVTERTAAEERLRGKEAWFRTLLESCNEVVMVVDAAGAIQYENPGAGVVLGYGATERIGRSSFDFVHPDDVAKVRDAYQRILRGAGRQVQAEFRMRHRDGAWRLFEGTGGGTVDLDGAQAAVVSLREVTGQRRAEQRLLQSMESAIGALAAAAELRDPHAAGQQRRVAALAEALARELKLDETAARGVRIAATVHDVGKIEVPAEILGKPSRLTAAEYDLVKGHAQAGADLLKRIELQWPIAEIVLQHHEAPDGSGYPRGLKGAEILLEARIVAVADAVESMLSRHPYRPAQSVDATLAEIGKHRGTKFDAQVVDACVRLFREKGYILAA